MPSHLTPQVSRETRDSECAHERSAPSSTLSALPCSACCVYVSQLVLRAPIPRPGGTVPRPGARALPSSQESGACASPQPRHTSMTHRGGARGGGERVLHGTACPESGPA